MGAAIRRGLEWLLGMQNRDGGWGAFDHDNDPHFLCHIPFADHNAMIDPSTADVTARAMECLGQMGWPATHPVIDGAGVFCAGADRGRSWFGRWGVNYVYGTSGVLRALETVDSAATGVPVARWNGCARCKIPTADSANRSFLLRSGAERARGRAPRRKRPGA